MKRSTLALTLPALLLCSLAAQALELPDMKPGLWQTTIKHASGKPGTMSTCLDTKAQAEAKQTAADFTKKNCSKNETRRDGDKWVTDMVCKLDGSTSMITHSVTTFSSETAYHTEMSTTYEPAKAGHESSTTTVDGKFLGACKGN